MHTEIMGALFTISSNVILFSKMLHLRLGFKYFWLFVTEKCEHKGSTHLLFKYSLYKEQQINNKLAQRKPKRKFVTNCEPRICIKVQYKVI